MKILHIAPQPLYQDRGTSIANKMVIEVLAQRYEHVDVVTYHEGRDFHLPNVTIHRIPDIPFLRGIRPGFSLKKLVCDVLMLPLVLRLVIKNRYDSIHAVEESAFIALLLKWIFRVPYVYDMDSSLAQQMVERFPALRAVNPVLRFFEGLVIRRARAVVAVCDALADVAREYGARKLIILRDVPLLDMGEAPEHDDLRARLGIDGPMVMYVGNLEPYQGIDLLLESFQLALQHCPADLVIIGGQPPSIARYTKKAQRLGIGEHVHFVGQRPISHLMMYLTQADVLASPRTRGANTPMKIYSYLYSGTACIATDLWTHTQILNTRIAVLAAPNPQAFADGLVLLLADPDLRARLGAAATRLIQEKYDYTSFARNLNQLIDWLQGVEPRTPSLPNTDVLGKTEGRGA